MAHISERLIKGQSRPSKRSHRSNDSPHSISPDDPYPPRSVASDGLSGLLSGLSGVHSSSAGSLAVDDLPRSQTYSEDISRLDLLQLWDEMWYGSYEDYLFFKQAELGGLRVHNGRGAWLSQGQLASATVGPANGSRNGHNSKPSPLRPEFADDEEIQHANRVAAARSFAASSSKPGRGDVGVTTSSSRPGGGSYSVKDGSGGVTRPAASEQEAASSGRSVARSNGRPTNGSASNGNGNSSQPVLGTWAHRQYRITKDGAMSSGSPQPAAANRIGASPSHGDANPAVATAISAATATQSPPIVVGKRGSQADTSPQYYRAGGGGGAAAAAGPSTSGDEDAYDEEKELEAAWRWRFTKRWQAEQTRVLDPQLASGNSDKLDEALNYLNACGEGYHMHLGRTVSTDQMAGFGSAADLKAFGTLETPGGGAMLLMGADSIHLDDSYSLRRQEPCLAGAEPTMPATRQVSQVNKQAQQLLIQQGRIEKEVEERWRQMANGKEAAQWVGQHLKPVEVEDWGQFKFLMLRLRDRADRQKLLIRGRNYASEGSLVEAVHREMVLISNQHGLPMEAIEVVGGGVMEWRRDRDRHLHIHDGFVTNISTQSMTPDDLVNLAGVLTKQCLPMHYKVSIGDQKVL